MFVEQVPEMLHHNYSISDFSLLDLDLLENPPEILNLDSGQLIHHNQKSEVTNLNETDSKLPALYPHERSRDDVVSHTSEKADSDETEENRPNKNDHQSELVPALGLLENSDVTPHSEQEGLAEVGETWPNENDDNEQPDNEPRNCKRRKHH